MTPGPVIRQRPLPSGPDQLPATLHPVSRRVLLARGVSSPATLDLGLGSLAQPSSLGGISLAAELLAAAVMEDARILIVGDFDADGATGTALAMRALRAMGARQLAFRVPNRFEFGYGLTPGLVDTLQEAPPDLLVTVDSGINCIKGVDRAGQLGIRVLVTDHHLPGATLPAAAAIVNPNLPGDAFPSKALAGVGVMFYLLSVLRQRLREQGWFGSARPEPNLARQLDLVALGTVADLVPLDHNNRVLVRQGLERIRAGQASEGLLALLRLGGRDYRHCVASDLGFAVAPRLNAAGRLEDMAAGIHCLLSDDPEEAMQLALQLDELNRHRRGMQDQMSGEALAMARAVMEGLAGEPPLSLCLYDPDWHQGIVGLVASKVKDAAWRPVIAFAPENPGAPLLKGSARSITGLHIRDVLAHVDSQNPGLIRSFGGHAMAAGLSLDLAQLESFRQALEHSVHWFLEGAAPEAELHSDGELAAAELGLVLARELRGLGPWGQRFPEPVFDGRFRVLKSRVVGGAHLKMTVRHPDGGPELDAIAFGKLPEDLKGATLARFLYRLDLNHFRGEEICQLLVERIL